jgi:hypothetical protein
LERNQELFLKNIYTTYFGPYKPDLPSIHNSTEDKLSKISAPSEWQVTDNNYPKLIFQRKPELEKWAIKETNYPHMKLHKFPTQIIGIDIEDSNEWEIIENNFPNLKLKRNREQENNT